MLRSTLLYAADQPTLKQLFSGALARPLVKLFVAGEDLQTAMETTAKLNQAGMTVALDNLGEAVFTVAEAGAAATEYVAIFHAIARAGAQAHGSLKLTQMGLDVDDALCRRSVERLAMQAAQFGNELFIDMEGSAYTQVTLDLFTELFARQKNLASSSRPISTAARPTSAR